jgi:hypothetical protein
VHSLTHENPSTYLDIKQYVLTSRHNERIVLAQIANWGS